MTETELIKNHIIDLSRMSYERGIYTFSDFMTLAEQSDLFDVARAGELYSNKYTVSGGYEGAERVVVRFGTIEELGYEQPWPISCIKITPLNAKFAESLSHRDVLGSLMNLGIERHLLGDILLPKSSVAENDKNVACAYVFALEHIATTICNELTRIKHTSVMATVVEDMDSIPRPSLQNVNMQVKSERIDLVVAHTYNLSRSQASELFLAKKVFINGRLMENESHTLSEADIVSVRGYGKFIYGGATGKTKKGNLNVTIDKYI